MSAAMSASALCSRAARSILGQPDLTPAEGLLAMALRLAGQLDEADAKGADDEAAVVLARITDMIARLPAAGIHEAIRDATRNALRPILDRIETDWRKRPISTGALTLRLALEDHDTGDDENHDADVHDAGDRGATTSGGISQLL